MELPTRLMEICVPCFPRLTHIIILCLATTLPACSEGGGESVVVSDSAGIRIVSNLGADQPLNWTFSPSFALGGQDEGPESFYNVRRSSVGTDAAGNIYVLDADGHRIIMFDSSGEFVRAMGREGEGPGELSWPFGLSVRPDGTVLVDDIGKGILVEFAPDGVPRNTSEPILPGSRRVWSDAGLLSSIETREDEVQTTRLVRVVGTDTTDLRQLASAVGGMIELPSCGMGFSGMPQIFAPNLVWDAFGDRTAVRLGIEYSVDVLVGTDQVSRITRSVGPTPSSDELAGRELGEAMQVMTSGGLRECATQELLDQRGVASELAAIRDLRIDPAGRLWVSRAGPRPESTPTDILDSDGTYLGTLGADVPYPIGFLPDGRVLVTETDDLDVTRLVVYEIMEVP